ncbi:MAG: hypothetical protein KKB62_01560 [Nanoarchaeota archaeon]|nr:hypothetical protein [Nanoarchaeota archaeon]
MNKGLKIIIGLILIVVPLYLIMPGMALASLGVAAWEFLKGGITLLVILMGLILVVMGIIELRN